MWLLHMSEEFLSGTIPPPQKKPIWSGFFQTLDPNAELKMKIPFLHVNALKIKIPFLHVNALKIWISGYIALKAFA